MDDWQTDIDSPLKAIERIAQSEDRMLAIHFFLFFSRFEYALKCLNMIKGAIYPAADWDGYARSSRAVLWFKESENAEFLEAVEFLEMAPPKQQDFSAGRLVWKKNNRADEVQSLEKTLAYVRTVRNNLFHGSKLDSAKGREMSRDRELIKRCLTILATCLEGDGDLREKFLEGLD